jgi:LysM repeat protein
MGITLVILFMVIVGSIGALVFAGGGGDDDSAQSVRSATTIGTATPTAPLSTTTGPPVPYAVMRGDTVTSIAQKFGVSTKAILAINTLDNPDSLTEGQRLMIPAKPPLLFTITPSRTPLGESVRLMLTGAQPSETVRFAIQSPAGTFTGPAHTASDVGTVSTRYTPALADPTGIYHVVVSGSQGTAAEGSFEVRK